MSQEHQVSEVPLQQQHSERVTYPAVGTDADPTLNSANLGSNVTNQFGPGTDVMGDPVNPSFYAANQHAATAGNSAQYVERPVASSNQPANNGSQGGIPSNQPGNYQAQEVNSINQPVNSPYVQTTSVPGKTPMDSIMEVFNKWGKKAEDLTGNVWNHLQTGPNVAETAWGRLAVGTKVISGGGLEKLFKQTFPSSSSEQLLKTYACYLSTSTGPVAGTLYISSEKLAFCSDMPLSTTNKNTKTSSFNNRKASSPPPNKTTSGGASSPPPASKTTAGGEQQEPSSYYKVMVPLSQLQAVNPSENAQKKPPEKYVQVKTVDGHEFWFMGFVHYDKGVKNLQESLVSKSRTNGNDHPPAAAATTPTVN